MPTEKPRYTITLDEEMLKAIDDFRFEHRYPNRTQATLELIRLGLESLMKKQAQDQEVPTVPETDDTSYIKLIAHDGDGVEVKRISREKDKEIEKILRELQHKD